MKIKLLEALFSSLIRLVVLGGGVIILNRYIQCTPTEEYEKIIQQISGMQQSIEMQNADNLMTMETYFNDCNNHPEEGN